MLKQRNKQKNYLAPEIQVNEIEVEQGFAVSTEDVGKTHDEQDW